MSFSYDTAEQFRTGLVGALRLFIKVLDSDAPDAYKVECAKLLAVTAMQGLEQFQMPPIGPELQAGKGGLE